MLSLSNSNHPQKLVDIVLVIFGAMIGYSGDDINKFLWMVRIAEGEHPQDIRESNYFTPSGEYRVDEQAPKIFTESVMYKCSYYRFGELMNDPRAPGGYVQVLLLPLRRAHERSPSS